MPHKKLFVSLGALVFGLIFGLGLLLFGYFSPSLPAVIAQEVEIGTLKGVGQRIIQLNPPQENLASTTRLVVAPRQDSAPELRLTSVETTQPTETTPTNASQSALSTNGNATFEKNWIQIGTFTDPNNLNRVLDNLKTHNFSPSTEPTTINGKAANRVFIGPFANAELLEQQRKALEPLGYNGHAVKRSTP